MSPTAAGHGGHGALTGTVLVTGATGGIGQALTRALAARGARLILTGRRADVLDELAQEVGARGLVCDLAQREAVDRLATEAARIEVDVLIANAALPASGQVTELTQVEIDHFRVVLLEHAAYSLQYIAGMGSLDPSLPYRLRS